MFSQGSVAIAGAVVRWLKDNLGIIQTLSELGVYLSLPSLKDTR